MCQKCYFNIFFPQNEAAALKVRLVVKSCELLSEANRKKALGFCTFCSKHIKLTGPYVFFYPSEYS